MYTLYGRAGWGSVLIEAQLAMYGLDFTFEEVDDLFASAAAREALARINPLAQVPTLVMHDGSIMTESAAITLVLAEITGSAVLVPGTAEQYRPRFLRWLVFLVANVYPTFTFADDPGRFVPDEAARAGFADAVGAYAERLWRMVEHEARGGWFLGERLSVLDLYIAAMSHWRPRRPWFAEHCPKLDAIAKRADALPELEAIWHRNFPGDL